jgi:pimeloyl-ACP methyl ester carboxylesterase
MPARSWHAFTQHDHSGGVLGVGLPCLSFGDGPPLVMFPGLGMTNANPTGLQRWGEVRLLAPLARAFTVHRVGRRVGLEPGTTMSDLVNDYAGALEEEFGDPVNVLGISTGGSLTLQLATDRPELVRRLVVAGAAYRLSEHGREFQRRVAELAAAGDRREKEDINHDRGDGRKELRNDDRQDAREGSLHRAGASLGRSCSEEEKKRRPE